MSWILEILLPRLLSLVENQVFLSPVCFSYNRLLKTQLINLQPGFTSAYSWRSAELSFWEENLLRERRLGPEIKGLNSKTKQNVGDCRFLWSSYNFKENSGAFCSWSRRTLWNVQGCAWMLAQSSLPSCSRCVRLQGREKAAGFRSPLWPLSRSCKELGFRAAKKRMVLLRVLLQPWPISFPWLFSRREFGMWLRNASCFFAGKSWTNYWARNAFQKHHSEIILLIRDLLRALSSFYKLEQQRVWMF